jgi:hypothetical protein
MPEGIKVEVKSAAYLQSWHQNRLSNIIFSTKKTSAWDPDTNIYSKDKQRQADVYVFALLSHQDKATINPLDINQWEFYVLPTNILKKRNQHSIPLPSLKRLTPSIKYPELCNAVRAAAKKNKTN